MALPIWTMRGRVADPDPTGKTGPEDAASPAGSGPFRIWGIVNITPDSFSDGGRHFSTDAAVDHALRLEAEGASVLDLGGASSRPGASEVSAAEEKDRVMPVLETLLRRAAPKGDGGSGGAGEGGRALLSVDTWRAEVADAALAAGADVINDISACAWEPALREVAASHDAGYVLMHCQGRPGTMQAAPRYDDVVDEVRAFFEREMRALTAAGLRETNILLDPGIGFGKTAEHNRALLAGTERLLSLGRPLLLGVSRKSLFGDLLGLPIDERGEATAVCTALMAARGVTHHRVHDVASARRALALVRLFAPAE